MTDYPTKCKNLIHRAGEQAGLKRTHDNYELLGFAEKWIKKFQPTDANDFVDRFIYLWITINAWASMCVPDSTKNHTDKTEALEWHKKRAEDGDSLEQFTLGMCYEYGDGVDIDHFEAAKWYKLAAEQGHEHAQQKLADCYFHGRGVDIDKTEAIKWYKILAEEGNIDAQGKLYFCYLKGDGVEAEKWMDKIKLKIENRKQTKNS